MTDPAKTDERAWLPGVARGDREAIRACIERYGPLVWALARRHCAEPAEVEDAVQEIFVDLWKSAARFDAAAGSEPTFVATLARRRLIDRYRRRARRPIAGAPREPTVASEVESKLDGRRALAALDALPDDQRTVVRLAAVEGLSHAEIAASTRLPLGTVKSHARRGLLRLRDLLHGHRGAPGLDEEGAP